MKKSSLKHSHIHFGHSDGLPHDFGETIAQLELDQLNGKINIDSIKQMLTMYSVAMEYFDSINDRPSYELYHDKNNKMLTNPNIQKFLEQINKERNIKYNIQSKAEPPKPTVENQDADFHIRGKRRSETVVKRTDNIRIKEEAEEIIKYAKLILEDKLVSLSLHWKEEHDKQNRDLSIFIEEIQRAESSNKKRSCNRRRTSSFRESIRKASVMIKDPQSALEALIEEETRLEAEMNQEIDSAFKRSYESMEKEIEDIKKSYANDIANFEEMGDSYTILIDGLKEDMEIEIENLKVQFDELRSAEIDRIKTKYL